jgi:L-threonylcarbamoyladenylate synthase
MERMTVDSLHPDGEVLAHAGRVIREGGVVAYPTETFYGLGANVFDPKPCRRIIELKGRDWGKQLPLIVSDLDQIELLCEDIPPSLRRLARVFWPGPLTLVIAVRDGLSGDLAGRSTAALRVSGLPLARDLARVAATPLTATSANPSDRAPAQRPRDLDDVVGDGVDLLLDGGPTAGGSPSTIVDVSGVAPRLLREGPVAFEAVLEVLLGRM